MPRLILEASGPIKVLTEHLDALVREDEADTTAADLESLANAAVSDPRLTVAEGPLSPAAAENWVGAPRFGDGPLARAARSLLINSVARRRPDLGRSAVADVVAKFEADSDTPLLDWLREGGLQFIIDLILSLLGRAILRN